MTQTLQRANLGGFIYFAVTATLAVYFAFAAIQGDYGVVRRVEISAEGDTLRGERDRLAAELGEMRNLTRRLSDAYLDLDLLDQQARAVLGYMRADEITIR
jgi:cell division protein FtsB